MKKVLRFAIFIFIPLIKLSSQPIGIEQIIDNGHPDHYINIVILGDGYTASQQDKFIKDSKSFSEYLFRQQPFEQYKSYFNVYAIKVISIDSGARHDHSAPDCPGIATHPVSTAKTYFESRFDAFNIHRLVVPFNSINIGTTLASYFPNYDQVFMLVNSPFYGGSGGAYATSTLHSSSNEISVHELGHSFSGLADEYYAGDQYAREAINMTKITDPSLVKWKNWLGFNAVGIYQHCCGGNSSQWFKPHQGCKMQSLGLPFCSVCSEGITERIHELIDPLVSYSPKENQLDIGDSSLVFKLSEFIRPEPNTLEVEWNYNNRLISNTQDSLILMANEIPLGKSNLSVFIHDTNTLLRVNNHINLHFTSIEWRILKTVSSIQTESKRSRFEISISPNPATDYLNINIEAGASSEFVVRIFDQQGKESLNKKFKINSGLNNERLNLIQLNSGIYNCEIIINNKKFTEQFMILK